MSSRARSSNADPDLGNQILDSSALTTTNGALLREGGHVAEMQRRRLLCALSELALEQGLRTLTVTTICKRAGLSRKTFYGFFEEREEFLLAAFDDGVAQACRTVAQATFGLARWRDRIRAGLTALLGFLDHEPGIGRLLVVEALSMGEQTLDARRLVLAQMTSVIDDGRAEAKVSREPPPLTAEGVVGAVFSVIHARMLQREERPLTELAGPLMAMIVQPYLGAAIAQKELGRLASIKASATPRLAADPFKGLPMRLTYRTARVLCTIAASPGVSSKQVAIVAGISDAGQTSKLLHRLQRYGLIDDSGIGPIKGLPRAWSLTERGHSVLQAVGQVSSRTADSSQSPGSAASKW